jgi:hypothetical protein
VKLAARGGHRFRDDFSLPASEALTPASTLAVALIQSLITRVDPPLIFDANNLLEATERYAKRLLEMPYERRQDPTSAIEQEKIEKLARILVRHYPTHDFVIDRIEAHKLGLYALPLGEYHERRRVVDALRDARRSGSAVLGLEELPPIGEPERWRERPTLDDVWPSEAMLLNGLAGHEQLDRARPEHALRRRRPRHARGLEPGTHQFALTGAGGYAGRVPPAHRRADHADGNLDDSWIWRLAPRPSSEPMASGGEHVVEVDLTEAHPAEQA